MCMPPQCQHQILMIEIEIEHWPTSITYYKKRVITFMLIEKFKYA